MQKAEIRKQELTRRLALNHADYQCLNQGLLQQFTRLNFSAVKTIHTFLPILSKKEPDTFLLIDWLAQHYPQIKIIIAKANFNEHTLTHYPYLGKNQLKTNAYQILEPTNQVEYRGDIDWVLVPLLAFDAKGYRVGYGKGFYDRFLKNLDAQKIGLSLFAPIESITDINTHDICLNACITPNQIFNF